MPCPRRAIAGAFLASAHLALAAGPVHALEEVPYVKTPPAVVEAILAIGAVGPKDTLIDLGSGDGRIVIAAARRFGTKGVGFDLDDRLVALANRSAAAAGVGKLARFEKRDIFTADLRSASVVTMYLLPDVNLALRDRLLATLKPGTRVVSHDYDMGDWRPDAKRVVPAPDKPVGVRKESDVFMWVVPAQVEGRWREPAGAPERANLTIVQRYQDVEVSVQRGEQRAKVDDAVLRGMRLTLRVDAGAGDSRWWLERVGERLVGEIRSMDDRRLIRRIALMRE